MELVIFALYLAFGICSLLCFMKTDEPSKKTLFGTMAGFSFLFLGISLMAHGVDITYSGVGSYTNVTDNSTIAAVFLETETQNDWWSKSFGYIIMFTGLVLIFNGVLELYNMPWVQSHVVE